MLLGSACIPIPSEVVLLFGGAFSTAAVAEMRLGTFSLYTVLGSLPWTFGLAAAGYALGTQWTTVRNYLLPVSIAFAALTVGAVAWWVVARLRRRAAEQPAAGDESRGLRPSGG